MEFSIWTPSRVDLAPLAVQAERGGFDSLHLYDSQMLYADLFMCAALCAASTERIRVGAGVTNPLTRIAPVMANSLATLNRLAPGRTFLAIGTGYTSVKTMGLVGSTIRELRDYVAQVNALLRGEETVFAMNGREGVARFLHLPGVVEGVDDSFYNLEDRVPVYMSAGGPRSLALAGELADAVILSVKHPRDLDVAAVRESLGVGAARAGRTVDDIGIMVMLNMHILEPGEDPLSLHVRESIAGVWQSQIGSWAARRPPTPRGFERIGKDEIPDDVRHAADAYRAALAPADPSRPHPFDTASWPLYAYPGHAWRAHPDVVERITAEFIENRAFVVEAPEAIAQFRAWEEQGVTSVGPQLQHDLAHSADKLARIARHVIPAFR